MKMLQVDTLASAREKLWKSTEKIPVKVEKVDLLAANGRYLAEDIICQEMVPGFRRSSVDGYAVLSGDTMGASESLPVFLNVIGEVAMGEEAVQTVHSGECVYVPTGGMIPDGADAMVMVEYCEHFSDAEIAVYSSAAPGSHVVEAGEDMKPGDPVLKAGRRLRPQDIGALASLGIMEVPVYVPWKVTVLSTGDEIVAPSETPHPGQVRDINTYGVCAQAEKLGLAVVHYEVVQDQEEMLRKVIRKGMEVSDLVAVSGGSSQGKKDATSRILDELADGGVFTHGLALKPGKPTILAVDEASETLLIGLPGHPVAAILVFDLLARWLWGCKVGAVDVSHENMFAVGSGGEICVRGKMSTNLPGAPGRMTCQLVQIKDGESGERILTPVLGKSGLISTLTRADGYVIIGENEEGLQKGQEVSCVLF